MSHKYIFFRRCQSHVAILCDFFKLKTFSISSSIFITVLSHISLEMWMRICVVTYPIFLMTHLEQKKMRFEDENGINRKVTELMKSFNYNWTVLWTER